MPVDIARVGTSEHPPPVGRILPLALAGAALLAACRLLGGPLVLPALSLVLLTTGFLVAAIFLLWQIPSKTAAEPVWLLAGALVLLGFAAALLSDGGGALIALDGMRDGSTVAASK